MGKISGFTVSYTAAGALVLYSGIKGTSLADTFRDLASGQLDSAKTEEIGTPELSLDTGGSAAGSASSSSIVADAEKYLGDRYVWGGIPGTTAGKDNGTDCSGFVNMVLGRDLGMAIPGYAAGRYTGSTHGPVTGAYLIWGGAKTISRSEAAAGDLACWQSHIGFFTDNGQHVISSLDTQSGVITTTVAGATPTGEVLFVRRING